NQIEVVGGLEKIAEILPYGVRRALIPARRFRSLLSSENFHKIPGKIIELITRIYVAMQRGTVELRQNIHPPEFGIQTVADRDIDQSIFPRQRDRRFRTILGQRKQTCSCSTAHDDGECCVLKGGGVHCSLSGL